jgi:hypothetical protein
MKYTVDEVKEAKEKLSEYLHPGDKVYTILRQVSRSGMSRHISTVIATKEGMYDITYLVARVIGEKRDQHDGGIVVSGAGMDMGFEIVYNLSRILFPDGFGEMSIGDVNGDIKAYQFSGIRPKSRANAQVLRDKGAQFRGRNGDTSGWDEDGGYALKQEWL